MSGMYALLVWHVDGLSLTPHAGADPFYPACYQSVCAVCLSTDRKALFGTEEGPCSFIDGYLLDAGPQFPMACAQVVFQELNIRLDGGWPLKLSRVVQLIAAMVLG